MPAHIPVMIVAKGAIAIGHWLAAHGTSAMAAKAATVIAHSVTTQGLVATATAVGTIAIGSSFYVGKILWTIDALELVAKGLQAAHDGDTNKMIRKFAKLALKLDINFHMLPDAVQDLLIEQSNFSYEDAHQVAQVIQDCEKEINREMNKKRK